MFPSPFLNPSSQQSCHYHPQQQQHHQQQQQQHQFTTPFHNHPHQAQHFYMPPSSTPDQNVSAESSSGLKRSLSEEEDVPEWTTSKRLRYVTNFNDLNQNNPPLDGHPPAVFRQESSIMSLDPMDTAESTTSSQTQPWQTTSHTLPALPAQFQRVDISDSSHSESPSPHSLYDDPVSLVSSGGGGGGNTPGSIMGRMDRLEVTAPLNSNSSGQQEYSGMVMNDSKPGPAKPGRFTMGFRPDCEKCRMKVPGHWAHPPADNLQRHNDS